ncbi:ankyrin repeat and BTB/POZ domain-containing protein 2-like [Thalassophryne amazonica]|uniref:ankyrin repeat and BTB/POZ domain-containing protein 2-like n=1 Tax=Thalassophryne amazonica TaxID=390379 RepID=UPI0014725692|nr:ankyrin repeat and BTB/POZ domain-containing protein 2-like [Thalassophryne amazonica]
MSKGLLVKTLGDLNLHPDYVPRDTCSSLTLSSSGRSGSTQPNISSSYRGWQQHTGSLYSRNSSWDTVSSLPEDAADILAKCPCLPELEEYPWTEQDLWEVVRNVTGSHASFTADAVHQLSVLLRRALVRISREAQRLSALHRRCTRLDIQSAVRLVLSWALAERCVSCAVRAVSLQCMSSEDTVRQFGKSTCCGLRLSVGRFFRWMVETRVSVRVHEYAAVYLTAAVEALAEEISRRALQAVRLTGEEVRGGGGGVTCSAVTADALDGAINGDAELWGVLQVCQHLMCGRNANGECSRRLFKCAFKMKKECDGEGHPIIQFAAL